MTIAKGAAVTTISRRTLIAGVGLSATAIGLSACTGSTTPKGSGSTTPFPTAWSQEITIDVFDGLANQMGTQPGWFAKVVKDKFNMKLNIIAPNVAGGGDTLYNTRVAAGNLGDLIITDKGQKMDELVPGGLLADMTAYYPNMTHAARFDKAVKHLNEGKNGVFGVPTQVSTIKPNESVEGVDPTFGPFLRWDLYAKVGYPAIGTLEDLLPVLKQMQDASPTADNGKKSYAISLFKDWDGNMMNNAKQPACYYGYDEMGFVLAMADGSDYQSILDSKSNYIRNLRWFHKANQMGLVDPDSTTQNYDTLYTKLQNGQVLFSFWPWQGQTAYNTDAHMAAGKGFMIAPMKDMKIFSYGAEAYGGKQILAIGSKAKDPERVAAFVDWLFSSGGVYTNNSQTMGSAGPKGLTWDMNAAKLPELTDFGKKALVGGDADVPADWGGGTYKDGGSWINTTLVMPVDKDPDTGYPYSYKMWKTFQDGSQNPLTKDWSSRVGGAATTMDYLRANKQVLVGAGSSFTPPTDSSEIDTIRNQVKAIIVQKSWKMSFAGSDSEFDSLLADLQKTADGLGYQKVLAVDMANAKAQNDARVATVKAFA